MSQFRIDLEVRDYECDVQGIVNNAVYLNYLEHARHKYLQEQNINFVTMSKEGKDLVVIESHIKYHQSLRFDEKFYIETKVENKSKLKFAFIQNIYRDDGTHILSAEIIGACIDRKNSKPVTISLK